jgi:release factor glutamine methyltransferase
MDMTAIKTMFKNKLSVCYDEREASLITKYYFEDKNLNEEVFSEADVKNSLLDLDRLTQFEPLQYVTGIAHFYGYKMSVNKNVLIPRPETEELVYQSLQIIQHNPQIKSIIDIGTGSGCIINTIAAESKNQYQYFGIDVDEDALKVAQSNANQMGVDVTFLKQDILNEDEMATFEKIDLIISNPPYISIDESDSMSENVLHYEPHLALFSDPDPLLFYKKIAGWAKKNNPDATIICEINEHFGKETSEVFNHFGYRKVNVIKDMQNKERIIIASI